VSSGGKMADSNDNLDDKDSLDAKVRGIKRKVPSISKNFRDVTEVKIVPSIQMVMDDAIGIIANEVYRLKRRMDVPNSALNEQESNKLIRYVKALTELSREERERIKSDVDKLKSLSDAELAQLAQSVVEDADKLTKG